MLTYRDTEFRVSLYEIADRLAELADSGKDCVGSLCSLSETGAWVATSDGTMEYRCDVEGEAGLGLTDNLKVPVAAYRIGGDAIPTKVARKLWLGEYVVCQNAGGFLQGIADRPVFEIGDDGEVGQEPTTLENIFGQGLSSYDTYFAPMEWRHLQRVVGPDGSQSTRYQILADILRQIADARMDEGTSIPYGHQFADSDFIDSF